MGRSGGRPRPFGARLPYIYVTAGILGLAASFMLTYDKIQLLKDPAFTPSCNINPILSCGSVMSTEQASLLGVPNTIFGIIAFTMLLTLGAILLGGVRLPRWIWIAAQLAATAGVVFMHYLFFQGVYRINAICPWCFVVWMVTIPVFWYTTLHNLQSGVIRLVPRLVGAGDWLQRHHGDLLFLWYAAIFCIIAEHFWYFWRTLLP